MDLTAILERYQTLLPWNLAKTKYFVNMILGIITSESVQRHKTDLRFTGPAKQESVYSALLICFMVGKGEEKKSPTSFKKTIAAHAFSTFRRSFDFLGKLLFQARDLALKLILCLIAPPRKLNKSLGL